MHAMLSATPTLLAPAACLLPAACPPALPTAQEHCSTARTWPGAHCTSKFQFEPGGSSQYISPAMETGHGAGA